MRSTDNKAPAHSGKHISAYSGKPAHCLIFVLAYCLIGTLFFSCDDRRDITDPGGNENRALAVHVKIDWTQAGITPDNASIWFFNAGDGTPALGGRPELTNEMEFTVHLPVGRYSLLVFNGEVHDHDNIRFRGTDRYDTFEAYAYNDEPVGIAAAGTRADESQSWATSPDVLAVDRLAVLEINAGMVERQEEPSVTFTPLRLVSRFALTVHFKGLVYSAASGHSGIITGMAGGVFLATGKTGGEQVKHAFALNHRTFYEGQVQDGTMSQSFYVFGLPDMTYYPTRAGETVNNLLLDILLRDGRHFSLSRDITRFISVTGDSVAAAGLEIKLVIDEPPVDLPYAPESDQGSGAFDPDVNGWGENTDILAPVD